MDRIGTLEREWTESFGKLARTRWFGLLAEGRLELRHYAGFLRETYHNVAQNPRNMALYIAHLAAGDKALVAKFLKHTAMEVGHDELALADFRALGYDADGARTGRPLPTTEALAAFIVFQIQHRDPAAYLGYLYHLEALPTHMGETLAVSLSGMGIPEAASSFLREHADADPVHMKWNREYLEGFLRTPSDLEAAVYGMRGACELHGVMLEGILSQEPDWLPLAPAQGGLKAARA